jgi:hypothetical protein
MLSLAIRLAGIVCALAIALPALADDVQDAAKLLKAGQHKQALERVNKALARSRAIRRRASSKD